MTCHRGGVAERPAILAELVALGAATVEIIQRADALTEYAEATLTRIARAIEREVYGRREALSETAAGIEMPLATSPPTGTRGAQPVQRTEPSRARPGSTSRPHRKHLRGLLVRIRPSRS